MVDRAGGAGPNAVTTEETGSARKSAQFQNLPDEQPGNPLRSERFRLVCSSIVFLLTLCLYWRTLAPTVTLVDSGELIVAGRFLGVAHPPGFPLYVVLAHLATLLPFGNVAMRVNLASAVFAAVAAAMIALAVAEVILTPGKKRLLDASKRGRARSKERLKQQASVSINTGKRRYLIAAAPLLVAGLSLGFSRTIWSYGTIAEVYTLNTMLVAIIAFLMLRWRRTMIQQQSERAGPGRKHEDPSPDGKEPNRARRWSQSASRLVAKLSGGDRLLLAAATVFGLALGVHHVTVGLMLPALAALVFSTEGFRFFISKRLLLAAIVSTTALIVVYSYLPLAASHSPVLNWGDPSSFLRLWSHVSGKIYQVFFTQAASKDLLKEFFSIYSREFGPIWLPLVPILSLAAMVTLSMNNKGVFFFLLLIVVADLAYGFSYEIAEDKDAYYLPIFVASAIAAGLGAEWLIRLVSKRPSVPAIVPAGAAVILLCFPLVTLSANLRHNDRSRYFVAHDYVDNILGTIEPGGMLLTLDWQVYSPMMYVREVEARRRDVIAIDANLLRRSWYYDQLRREYPELMEATHDAVDLFLEDLRGWENNADLYDKDMTLNRRINSRFNGMIMAFVGNQLRSGAVYVTSDLAPNPQAPESEITRVFASSYHTVPEGLVFQLRTDNSYHDPVEPELLTRGLADGTLQFEDDDVVTLKVIPAYLRMLTERGNYLYSHGQAERAIKSLREALRINPDFTHAKELIAKCENAPSIFPLGK
jgi:hypothetical protein